MLIRHTTALLLTGAALLAATPMVAQEKYDLTDLPPVAGLKTIEQSTMEGKDGKFLVNFLGQTITGEAAMQLSSVETFEIVTVKDGVITEYHTNLLESNEVFEFEILDEKNRDETISPLVNVPVRWTLIDEVYVPSLVEGEATEEQLAKLEPRPNTAVSEYPDQPVAVGESWTVKGDAFAQMLGSEPGEDMQGDAKMTFEQIVEVDGEACAKIAFTMTLTSPMPEEDLEGMDTGTLTMQIDGYVYRSLEKRIDVKMDCEGSFKIVMTGKADDIAMTTTVEIPITLVGTTKVAE